MPRVVLHTFVALSACVLTTPIRAQQITLTLSLGKRPEPITKPFVNYGSLRRTFARLAKSPT